jgi:hypothetical protein
VQIANLLVCATRDDSGSPFLDEWTKQVGTLSDAPERLEACTTMYSSFVPEFHLPSQVTEGLLQSIRDLPGVSEQIKVAGELGDQVSNAARGLKMRAKEASNSPDDSMVMRSVAASLLPLLEGAATIVLDGITSKSVDIVDRFRIANEMMSIVPPGSPARERAATIMYDNAGVQKDPGKAFKLVFDRTSQGSSLREMAGEALARLEQEKNLLQQRSSQFGTAAYLYQMPFYPTPTCDNRDDNIKAAPK